MNASALQAGAHAAKAFFGVAGAHALNDAIPALNLQQVASVFLLAYGIQILNYLDEHPFEVHAGIDADGGGPAKGGTVNIASEPSTRLSS